mmetsp:Transcript_3326/g.6271  ORF Transcript_3326/g.6271 Transcript_3326/m.6271 type:complete len:639 (+) Transcript_3326:8136-10052(+)
METDIHASHGTPRRGISAIENGPQAAAKGRGDGKLTFSMPNLNQPQKKKRVVINKAGRPASAKIGRPSSAKVARTWDKMRSAEHDVSALQTQCLKYTDLLHQAEDELFVCERNIGRREMEIQSIRKGLGSRNVIKENDQQVGKTVQILEKRIEDFAIKTNQARCKNQALRDTINTHRHQLLETESQNQELQNKIKRKRGHVVKLTATIASEQQKFKMLDSEKANIKARTDMDRRSYETMYLNLKSKAKEMAVDEMTISLASANQGKFQPRGKRRTENSQARMADKRRLRAFDDLTTMSKRRSVQLTKEEEQKLRASALQSRWAVAFTRALEKNAIDGAESYKDVYESVKTIIKVDSLEAFSRVFANIETETYEKFNFIADSQQQCEELSRALSKTKTEAEEAIAKHELEDVARRNILVGINKTILECREKTDSYDNINKQLREKIESYKAKIKQMLCILDPSREGNSDTDSVFSNHRRSTTATQAARALETTVAVYKEEANSPEGTSSEGGGNVGAMNDASMMESMGLIEQKLDEVIGDISAIKQRTRSRKADHHDNIEEIDEVNDITVSHLVASIGPSTPKQGRSRYYHKADVSAANMEEVFDLQPQVFEEKPMYFTDLVKQIEETITQRNSLNQLM